MQKIMFVFTVIFILLFPVFSRPQEEVKVQEEVSVVNVEVPVRVFFKGKAVDNLDKSDFIIYEGKKEQIIHGFYKTKKKIDIPSQETTGEAIQPQELPARYFVLVFRVSKFNNDLKKGVDYLFEKVLKKNDRLLVFANDKTLFLKNLSDKKQIKALIYDVLRQQSNEARQLMDKYLYKIRTLLEQAKIKMGTDNTSLNLISAQQASDLLEFLNRYLTTWKEYKNRYLVPDLDKYYNFARFLEKIAMEKWVLSFYQVELFPKLKLAGELRRKIDNSVNDWLQGRSEDAAYARKVMSLLHLLDRELNAAENFPAEEISKLFYKVGATFHSILMNVHREANVEDLEFKSLSTDIENSLRELTARTGGELLATNNLEKALGKVTAKEDIVYMLTYVPSNPQKVGKIKVELADKAHKKYDVLYDKNMREDYIREYLTKKQAKSPDVQLSNVSFKKKKLSMKISDFLMKEKGKKKTGQLIVHIRILANRTETVFDQAKRFEAGQETFSLSLGFKQLKKGRYNIIIDARDLLTGKIASEFLQEEVE